MEFLSSPDRKSDLSLTAPLAHLVALRFFDLLVSITSDAPEALADFCRVYARFVVEQSSDGATVFNGKHDRSPAHLPVDLCTRSERPSARVGDDLWPLPRSFEHHPHLLERVVTNSLAQVRSHLLFHGGALTHRGQGIVLAGDSGRGKTTLVLELVRRGFRFLSDDIAAIDRATGALHPFPRSLLIRPGTLERLDFPQSAAGDGCADATWFGKQVLDAEAIKSGCLGTPTPLTHLFLLGDDTVENRPVLPDTCDFIVDRADSSLFHAIERDGRLQVCMVREADGFVALRVQSGTHTAALHAVEEVCQRAGVLLLNAVKRWPTPYAFAKTASIQQVEQSSALLALVRHFLAGDRSEALGSHFQANGSHLLILLARLLKHVRCYRLLPGSPAATADLVCQQCA